MVVDVLTADLSFLSLDRSRPWEDNGAVMPPPSPPVPLKDHCSVVFNHTLYVYSPDAFQSIPLSEGGQWKQLPHGVSVQGATCVKVIPNGDEKRASMFVVGGAANSSISYPGLQRYLFAESRWEPVTPVDKVTQNRRNHGAVYLNSSSSILTYAGSQDTADLQPSSQTFLISTSPPYTVRSYSSKAPPLVRPLMLQWNESHAVMVGGGKDNRQVFTFSAKAGWEDLGVTLKNALPDQSKVQAALVQGDDGSKVLETFDLSTSPYTISQVVLQRNDSGQGPSPGESFVNSRPTSERRSTQPPPAKRRKRDLTLANWPSYDSSLAPKVTRSGFSLAQAPDGLVVISGGNPEDSLSLFNVKTNQWLNTSELWKAEATTSASSTAKPTSSALNTANSASATATTPVATSETGHGRNKTLVILGATLGAIIGAALLLVGILIWLRWRRKRRRHDEAGKQRRASGNPGDEKDRLSFADRGASFMSQAGGFLGHGQKESVNSSSSMAIMTGQGSSKRHKTGPFSNRRASGTRNSIFGRVRGKNPAEASQIGRPRMEESHGEVTGMPEVAKDPMAVELGRQSSGWSRYWTGESGAHLAQDHVTQVPDDTPSSSSGAISLPRHLVPRAPEPARTTQSTAPPPINFSRSHSIRAQERETYDLSTTFQQEAPLSTIHTGDAGVAISGDAESIYYIHGHDETPPSPVSPEDEIPQEATFSSDVRASANEEDTTWSPVGRESEWSSGRGASSVYTDSAHGSMIPSASAFPQVPRESTATVFPRLGAGVSLTNVPGDDDEVGQSSRHGVGGSHDHHQEEKGRHNSDMSWLNLGNPKEEG